MNHIDFISNIFAICCVAVHQMCDGCDVVLRCFLYVWFRRLCSDFGMISHGTIVLHKYFTRDMTCYINAPGGVGQLALLSSHELGKYGAPIKGGRPRGVGRQGGTSALGRRHKCLRRRRPIVDRSRAIYWQGSAARVPTIGQMRRRHIRVVVGLRVVRPPPGGIDKPFGRCPPAFSVIRAPNLRIVSPTSRQSGRRRQFTGILPLPCSCHQHGEARAHACWLAMSTASDGDLWSAASRRAAACRWLGRRRRHAKAPRRGHLARFPGRRRTRSTAAMRRRHVPRKRRRHYSSHGRYHLVFVWHTFPAAVISILP